MRVFPAVTRAIHSATARASNPTLFPVKLNLPPQVALTRILRAMVAAVVGGGGGRKSREIVGVRLRINFSHQTTN
eukprot:g80327.t1